MLWADTALLMQEETKESAETSATGITGPGARLPEGEHDLLREIPSPTRRLWLGLCVTLAIFVIFATYTIREIRWLQDFQVNVVQKNRKASLQLLRLQDDTYQLAVSLRDMTLPESRYPIFYWKGEFSRLREDMNSALASEAQLAVNTSAGDEQRRQLHDILDNFWPLADEAFNLAGQGHEESARYLIRSQLEEQRETISRVVSHLLSLNDQAQQEAGQRVSLVYGHVSKDILLVIGVLFLVALGTGLYTLQANRKTFERLHHLAEKLQSQSEQMRMLSWKLIEVQEQTLRHVARDLHDHFGQILTAIGVMLGRAGQKAAETDPVFVQDVRAAKKIVEDTLQSVRDESQIFRPAILDDFGLQQTLEWFAEQFSRQTGVQVHYGGKLADGLFPPEAAIHVYRIVQEALSNVARHSGAREAWVTLGEKENQLNLEIRDNGSGFEARTDMKRAAGQGMGLMGMRERAEHLQGSFAIRSAPQRGTTVSVRVPLRRPSVQSRPEEIN
ncbi:MAG: sensor histidine kinase [Terriglobia bacterium]|jgi:signal transduction histidine kinase